MAIVFAENSEHGNAPNTTYLWDIVSGVPAINSTNPIKGTYDIRVGRGSFFTDYMGVNSAGRLGTTTIVYLHFWYKLVTAPSAGNSERVCGIIATPGSGVLLLVVDEYARLVMGANFQLVIGQPVEVEFYAEVVPGTKTCHYAYWVNGTLVGAADSAFPFNETAISSVIIGGESATSSKFNFDAYYDDIVVDTERRIGTGLTLETEVPNADDATDDQWTADDAGAVTYDHVNDIPLVATDYAVSARPTAATQRQLWAFPATAAAGTVIAVDSLIAAQYEAAGTVATTKHRVSAPAGTAINTSIATAAANAYFRTCRILDCDAAAWTKTTADALRVGGEATKDGSGNERAMRITDVWKTVVYRDPPKDWAGII